MTEPKMEKNPYFHKWYDVDTTKGFITRYSIQGLCEVLWRTLEELAQGHSKCPCDAL